MKLTPKQRKLLCVYADHQRGTSRFGERCPVMVDKCALSYVSSEKQLRRHLSVLRRASLVINEGLAVSVTRRGLRLVDKMTRDQEIPF